MSVDQGFDMVHEIVAFINKINIPLLQTDNPSPNDEPEFHYYMNEGVYGSFSSKLTEMLIDTPSVHKVNLTLSEHSELYNIRK